jgi:hypothetical protein
MGRSRQHNETDTTYNPDLEYAQQDYADEMNGPGTPIGSWGMTGGQYPTQGKDRPGYGSGMFGDPWDPKNNPNTPGYGSNGTYGAAGDANRVLENNGGNPQYQTPSGYGSAASGGSSQWGPGGAGSASGGYDAMQPYQWGSGGASGNRNAAGGGAFTGYSRLASGAGDISAADRSNLMAASNEAIKSNEAATKDEMANRAATSGNTAGWAAGEARAGQQAGQNLEAADRANQQYIMNENQRRREAGLAGEAGMYGTETGYMGTLLGGRSRLASLTGRTRQEGTGTTGGGGVSASSFMG